MVIKIENKKAAMRTSNPSTHTNLQNDWGQYVDTNRKLLLSLEKIRTYVTRINNHSNISSDDAYSFGYMASKLFFNKDSVDNLKDILNNLKIHSNKIIELLDGGGDENEGLISLTRNEVNDVENFIKNNPAMPPDLQKQLVDLANNFNSKKVRLWENIRQVLNREETLGISLVNYTETTKVQYMDAIIKTFQQLHLVIEQKENNEVILLTLIKLTQELETLRSGFVGTWQHYIANKNIPNFKDEAIEISQNYFRIYKQSIKERLDKIEQILNTHNNKFIEIPEEDLDSVMKLYNEFRAYLFKRTSYEKIINGMSEDSSVEKLKTEYEDLIIKLSEQIKKHYTIPSTQEFNDLIVMSDTDDEFLKKKYKFGNAQKHKGKTLSIQGVKSKFGDVSNSKLKKLLVDIIKDLKLYITDSGFTSFERLQPNDNFIGMNAFNKLKETYNKLVQELLTKRLPNYEGIYNSGLTNIVLFDANDNKIKSIISTLWPHTVLQFLSFVDVNDMIDKEGIKANGLLKLAVNKVKLIIENDSAFRDFLLLQRLNNIGDNIINKVENKKEQAILIEKYWDEYGGPLEVSAHIINNGFRNFENFVRDTANVITNNQFNVNQFKILMNITRLYDDTIKPINQRQIYKDLRDFFDNFTQFTNRADSDLEQSKRRIYDFSRKVQKVISSLNGRLQIRKIEQYEQSIKELEEEERREIEKLKLQDKQEISNYEQNIKKYELEIENINRTIREIGINNTISARRKACKIIQTTYDQYRNPITQEVFDDQAMADLKTENDNQITRLRRDIQTIKNKISPLETHLQTLIHKIPDSNELRKVIKKIKNKKDDINNLKKTIRSISIPEIDYNNNAQVTDNRIDIEYDEIDIKISELENEIVESKEFIERYNSYQMAFRELKNFIDNVTKIFSLFGNEKNLKNIKSKYMKEDIWGPRTTISEAQIWYILNKDFKSLGGPIWQVASSQSNSSSNQSLLS